MGHNSISWSICSVLIVFSVLWNPAYTEDKCSIGCKGGSSGASFLNNHKYNYAVEGVVRLYLTGADKQETSVKVNGQVSVAAQGNCGYVLRVQNLQISGPDGKKYNKPPGVEKPVRFSLEDGKAGPEICTEAGDTRRSLNIKRAIISLLQSSQKQSTETDVFGMCPTDVSSSQEGGAVLVHRRRDLSRCGLREQGRNDLISGVYDANAEIKDTQVLESALSVESKVKNGVPEKVAATEDYLYKPFSVGQNGARAQVHTKLTLTGQTGGSDTGSFTEVRTIVFENPHGVKSEASHLQDALQALKDVTQTLQKEASSKSAGEFAQFVRILRVTSKDDLLKLYNQGCKGKDLEKRVFLDGLVRAGTGASVEVSIHLLKNNELNQIEQQVVFLSLGNAKHVTNDAIKTAATVLDMPNIPKGVYLGVGALAGTYCQAHRCHGAASQSPGIAAISQKFASKLQNCKPKNKVEEDYVVAALKGIRNIRHLEENLINVLAQCVNDKNVKSRVKVAALEAFHADPCTPKLKKIAIDTMKNRQLDSEIRIKAYMAVIDCPCGKSANEIKNLLESEPVHQVGRYISSSLRHIRSTANPDKQLARQHYGLIHTPSKFGVDDRKYSFYREGSFDIDALGVGANVEQNVIFSQDSFLPRSASLNVTTQLFGHSLNILEVGGRQGNLDRVIEHFVGPKGLLRTHQPQQIIEDLIAKYQEVEKKVEGKVRGRRAVKQDINNFDKQVKAESTPYNNELDLDIYVKLFGSDAVFLSLGDDKGFNLDSVLEEFLKQMDSGINQVKHFQKEVRAHLLFLDAELAYPTSTGFPLKLNLIGSATGRFEVATNLDVRQILRDPKNAKIDIKLVPSTDIEITGQFTVDADVVATGLKIITNLHTSTGGHLVAKVLENGHGVDINFGLPVQKQEIITATSDLVFVTREKGHKDRDVALKIDAPKNDYSGCFDQLSGVLGLTFCGEVIVPFAVSGQDAQSSIQKFIARYPLTGPASLKLRLEQNNLKGYHIKYVFHNDNPEKQSFELLFDAEGGQNRKTALSGELINTKEEKSVMLSLDSPIKKAYGHISVVTKPNEYVGMVKAKWDDIEYYGKAGFTGQGNERRSVYRPVLEYQMPGTEGKKSLKVDGQIVREGNGQSTKYSLEGIKVNMPNTNEVVDINGFLETATKNTMELKAKKGDHNLLLKGLVSPKDLSVEFQNTLNPNINFKVDAHSEMDTTKNHYQNDIDIVYGNDLKSKTNRVTINQLLKYQKISDTQYSLVTNNKFNAPMLPLVGKFSAEIDPKKLDIDIEGQFQDKKLEVDVNGRTQIKKVGDYNIKLKGTLNDKGIEIFSKRDCIDADKSNFENYVSIKNVGKYELSGLVNHKTKTNDVNVGATGHAKITTSKNDEEFKFDFGVQENPNVYESHLKLNTKTELVNYMMKINRGPNAVGDLKLTISDAISATGQFKVTDNDGKGNGGFIVHFKKADRKFKGDINFVAKQPIFDAEIDLFLNFGKKNDDKIHFKTHNKNTDTLIESKNQFSYNGKSSEVNVKAEGKWNGKHDAHVEVVLPTERVITFQTKNDFKSHEDVIDSSTEMSLSDSPKRNTQGSKITYREKFNSNFDKGIVNYEGELGVHLKDGKNLVNAVIFKNNPVAEKSYKFEYKHDVTGNIIPEPASLSAYADYTDEDNLIDGKGKYVVKANYGQKYRFDSNGNWEVNILNDGDKKFQEDYTVALHLPFENAREVKLSSNFMYLLPDNKDTYLEYTVMESASWNGEQYKVDASGKIGESNGFSKVKMQIPHQEPISLDVDYKNNAQGDKRIGDLEIKTTYGKGKNANVHITGTTIPNREHSLTVKAHAPQDQKVKNLEFTVLTKTPSAGTYNIDWNMDIDSKVTKSNILIVFSKTNPVMDFRTQCHDSKPIRIFVKADTNGIDDSKYEIKMENIKDFNADVKAEVLIRNENVAIKADITCDKWNLNNAHAEIMTKDSGNGKRIEFQVTNNNKNVVSGSTSFLSKQEDKKVIIEGSGSVKINDQQKSAAFKYIRTVLNEGNEQGLETFVDMTFGERSYVGEMRITNLEYKTSYLFCEEKKQCAHVEFDSKLQQLNKNSLQHTVNIVLDLRKLGINPEFGLQWKNEIADEYHLVSTLDVHLNVENKKYHLHAYNKPFKQGVLSYESGMKLTLPTRVIAVESVFKTGNRYIVFPIESEVSLYMDKNKPNQKISAKTIMDLYIEEKKQGVKAEFTYSHPALPKPSGLGFHGKSHEVSANHFVVEGDAFVGPDCKSEFFMEVEPRHVKLMINTPLVKLIEAEGSIKISDKLQESDFSFSLLGGKSVAMRAVAKEYKYFEFTTGYSESSDRKLSIIGHIEPEKKIDISADIILPDGKKNIAHGALFIDNNLVKSDYGTSKENFDYFIAALKGDIDRLEERIKELADKAKEDVKNRMHRYQETAKKVEAQYLKELESLKQELVNDKTLQEISKNLDALFQFVAKIAESIITGTSAIATTINKIVTETWDQFYDIYKRELKGQLEQIYKNISDIINEVVESLLKVVTYYASIVSDFIEQHKKPLNDLIEVINNIFKEFTRLVISNLKEYSKGLQAFIEKLTQDIKDMPVFAMLKEKFEEWAVPDKVIQLLNEFYNAVQPMIPTEEAKQLVDAIFKYMQKKIKNEKTDDQKELKIIAEKMATAFSSLITFIQQQLNQIGMPSIVNVNIVPTIGGVGQSWPTFGGSASFSVINQLFNGDFLNPLEYIKAYRPRSFNPLDEIPAKMRGVVVNGEHIFTFDGSHLTFPGNCRYVLAHDHVDRNFTLVMQLQNGKLKTLTLEDKSGAIIELKDNGQATLNGANHGFPISEKDIYAFKQPSGRVGLHSNYGLTAFCTSKLNVCYFEVSGFYLGKLRGLLGDGNNEPYDDFRLPNGKIVNSPAEFGHAYRLSSSCPVVKVPEHSHHQMHAALPQACEKVFGGISPLRPLSLFLDIAPFRQACIHAVAANQGNALEEACDLARGYTALAVTGLLPATLPAECIKCTDADKPREFQEQYEIKLPAKQADVVILVETTKGNEKTFKDLVVPMVSQIVDGLKAKQVSDIKVYLVGITSKMPYALVYDIDNVKMKGAKIKFTDESRYNFLESPIDFNLPTLNEFEGTIIHIINDLMIQLGAHNAVAGYNQALELPLRAGAVKSIISVVSEHCKKNNFLVELTRGVVMSAYYEMNAVTHALITVTPDMTIGGGKPVQQIIGYDASSVLFLGDKKRGKDTEQLREQLDNKPDACIDYHELTKGLVFSATNFASMNGGQQKQFIQTAGQTVVDRMTHLQIVQECTCVYADPFRMRSACIRVSSKEAPARRRK